jgi:hypothetical protein
VGFVNSIWKEIKLSFEVSIVLKQTDVHWVEEELLRMREGVGNGMFIGNSVEKNLSDMLLDLYHGKKDAYILLISIDDHSKKW